MAAGPTGGAGDDAGLLGEAADQMEEEEGAGAGATSALAERVAAATATATAVPDCRVSTTPAATSVLSQEYLAYVSDDPRRQLRLLG